MKKAALIFLIGLCVLSCNREPPSVKFTIDIEGFEMNYVGEGSFNQMYFQHRFSGATVRFSRGNDVYDFNTKTASVEAFTYTLPAGTYTLQVFMDPASIYGQAAATFDLLSDTVHISVDQETLTIDVVPNCALFFVSDKLHQIEDGPFMIERYPYGNGYYRSYPLAFDAYSGLYFSYFTPDPYPENPSAYLWFYGEDLGPEQGGYSTVDCEPGTVYYFEVLD